MINNKTELTEIEKVVDEYVVSHKGNMQCKCISGARGHLIAKLNSILETAISQTRQELIEEIKGRIHYSPKCPSCMVNPLILKEVISQ